MTREEELDWLYRLRSEIYVFMPKEWLIPMSDALNTAIKALEQQSMPTMVYPQVEGITPVVVEPIPKLPPVNQQEPKTGYWKERRSRATGHIEIVCSECGAEKSYPYNDYCGNCGAKMVDEQESEDKE